MEKDIKRQIAKELYDQRDEVFLALLESFDSLIAMVNPEGIVLYVNRYGAQTFGAKNPEEVIGTNLNNYFPDEVAQRLLSKIKHVISSQQGLAYEVVTKSLSREPFWVRTNIRPILTANAYVPQAVLINAIDITERKKNEEALHNQKNKLDSIIKAAPIGIGITINRVFQEVNDTFCTLTGYTEEELLGNSSRILYPSQEEYETVGSQVYSHNYYPRVSTFETTWLRKDGRKIAVLLCYSPINSTDISQGLIFTVLDFTEKKQSEIALKESEERYRLIADNTGDTISVMSMDQKMIYVSPSVQKLLGFKVEEAMGLSLNEMLTPNSLELVDKLFNEEIAGQASGYALSRNHLLELEMYQKNGSPIWVEAKYSFLFDGDSKPSGILVVTRDIRKRKKVERENYRQKAKFEALFTNTNDAMVFFDVNENITNVNSQFLKLFGYEKGEVIGKYINDIIDPNKTGILYGSPRILKGQNLELEDVRYTKAGQPIDVSLKGGPVYYNGNIAGGYVVYANITERKRYEQELKFLSLHDKLTGLYNRTFFEEEIKRLNNSRWYPITIISIDVDGLKIINDTMGHDCGDELLKACAQVAQNALRSSDILARIGGDEFAVILPQTSEKTAENLLKRIRVSVDEYNQNYYTQLSISVGIATADSNNKSLEETFKKADDAMYRHKLHKAASAKSQIIDTLMKALRERDYITEGHGKRLSEFCLRVGERIGLSSSQLDNIALLAQVHDLGKVGIPDNILFKEGPLSEEEWEIMRQHPEKGFRIAITSPDLAVIADLILKHHERWDGRGYPLGLKMEEIPIECRILSIVDAFDAMTSDRPYSKGRTMDQALAEIQRCSGTQFDPELTDIFLAVVHETISVVN